MGKRFSRDGQFRASTGPARARARSMEPITGKCRIYLILGVLESMANRLKDSQGHQGTGFPELSDLVTTTAGPGADSQTAQLPAHVGGRLPVIHAAQAHQHFRIGQGTG